MRNDLDALLCERYPLIFADRDGDLTRSGMPFGFQCGDGWFALIDALCERLQFWTDHNDAPQIVATQVKEKFGELCFYVESSSDMQQGMIAMAEAMSARLCEECGQPSQLLVDGAFFLARCPAHAPARAITADEYHARRQVAAKGENS